MERSTKIGLGIFLLIVVGGIFFVNSNKEATVTGRTVQAGGGGLSGQISGDMRHVTIDARRFDFGPEIRVKHGEEIMLMINNIDTTHGIRIPGLGVGGNNRISFTADKKGEFDFYCNTYCGVGHAGMTGKIIVE